MSSSEIFLDLIEDNIDLITVITVLKDQIKIYTGIWLYHITHHIEYAINIIPEPEIADGCVRKSCFFVRNKIHAMHAR